MIHRPYLSYLGWGFFGKPGIFVILKFLAYNDTREIWYVW